MELQPNPFMLAYESGDIEALKECLMDPAVSPQACQAGFEYVIKNGNAEAVKLLLMDLRVSPQAGNDDAIRVASENGHTEVVKLLLKVSD